ncbi:hypothetical protein WAE61_01405 [Comamonadaceae bacterium PP-2]
MNLQTAQKRWQDFLVRAGQENSEPLIWLSSWTDDEGKLSVYEKLIGSEIDRRRSNGITKNQAEACLSQLIREEIFPHPMSSSTIQISYDYEITEWKVEGVQPHIPSKFRLRLGSHPSLGTELYFNSIQQFEQIKRYLLDAGLCKLNEKHLLLMKRIPK